jgi:peroxiredoxin family protein
VEATDVKAEDLRDGADVVGVTTFLVDTQDATRSFSF